MREGQAVQHGQITLGKEQRARLLAAGIRFFLTAALCDAPFALGCVSAAGPGVGGGAALAGAGLGALVFMDFAQGLPFLATAALIFTTAQALRGWRAVEDRRWSAVVAAGLFLTVGIMWSSPSLRLRMRRPALPLPCSPALPPGFTGPFCGWARSSWSRTACCF